MTLSFDVPLGASAHGPGATGGSWDCGVKDIGREEARRFVSLLAKGKARQEGWLFRRWAEQAWRMRWASIIACSVARAVAVSVLNLPRLTGADGNTPLACDVERDFRHVGLAP